MMFSVERNAEKRYKEVTKIPCSVALLPHIYLQRSRPVVKPSLTSLVDSKSLWFFRRLDQHHYSQDGALGSKVHPLHLDHGLEWFQASVDHRHRRNMRFLVVWVRHVSGRSFQRSIGNSISQITRAQPRARNSFSQKKACLMRLTSRFFRWVVLLPKSHG